ncbi:MAG: NADH-quinone oxidoreductase subunit N [Akkermansiaceae bacterium]|jgi:NADH-quinone oxidoreductase subunit N|nr:NADH-quinone oxidoreductase subunit N [Akkermansiaceae bacterium]
MQPHLIEFITVGLGILLLLLEAFTDGSKTRIGLIAAAGLAGILILELTACGNCTTPAWMERFYDYDSYARYFKVIALAATILVLLMSVDMKRVLSRYTSGDDSGTALGEFFCLPVFTCAGLMWMASARDLVSIFVALELVTIAFYVMVAYMRRNVGSLEAGVKYLILGALSTGFLVYGIAWIYGATGTMDLSAIDLTEPEINQTRLLFGLALLLIAFGFKVGAAPMQLWIPDVYQGAPTPVTAYLSVASKAAGFVVMMMVLEPFLMADSPVKTQLQTALYIIAGATLLYGNLAAISQQNFKRLLAYSSIAHAGFLLMGIGSIDFTSVAFYLGIYLIMTFTAFFILALVRDQENSDTIDAFDGLGKRNPLLASCLTISMAALAGIPLTAGFWGKFFIFRSAIETNVSWWLIAIAFVSVATGFYYYLKVVKAMYWNNPHNDAPLEVPTITKYVIAVLTSSIIMFGVWPQPILDMLK